jgi:serine/threonine protein phosphatase PrpC
VSKTRSSLICGGVTIRGSSHERSGLPNQDAIDWWPKTGQGSSLIVAVADGHGSAKCFRSDRGSRIAVEVAITQICQFFQLQKKQSGWGGRSISQWLAKPELIQQDLPQQIVSLWQEQVAQEILLQPFLDHELATLATKESEQSILKVQQQPSLAYGATLLAVCVTEAFSLYLQLGDGDILCVDGQGQATRALPKDPRMIANETTSLCGEASWRDLHVRLVPANEDSTMLILLSTDGYANAFTSEADFLKIGPDYLQMIQAQRLEVVLKQLPLILQDASRQGSGDDITLGIIQRQIKNNHNPKTSDQPPKRKILRPEEQPTRIQLSNQPQAINLEELRQTIHRQQVTIQRLKLGLIAALLLALFALGVVGYTLTQLQALKAKPQQKTTFNVDKVPSQVIPEADSQFSLIFKNVDDNADNRGIQIALNPNVQLYQYEGKMTYKPNRGALPVAQVILTQGGLAIKNLSQKNWQTQDVTKRPQTIIPNQFILLKDGLKIDFGVATGSIIDPLHPDTVQEQPQPNESPNL